MNCEKSQDKKLIYTIIGVIIMGVVTPFTLELVVFRSEIYSAIDNSDWASFLGSFLGGVIGGIGTLIAVYFTTNQTRKIQEDNENKLNEEIVLRKHKERKEFANEIATLVSKYIADSKKYYRNFEYKNQIENEIKELQIQVDNYVNYSDGSDVVKLKVEVINNKINEKSKEKNSIRLDRSIADECYNLLTIKLSDIDKASEIIECIYSGDYPILFYDLNEKLHELRNKTNKFINDYVENGK